jgi:hypothetical protein
MNFFSHFIVIWNLMIQKGKWQPQKIKWYRGTIKSITQCRKEQLLPPNWVCCDVSLVIKNICSPPIFSYINTPHHKHGTLFRQSYWLLVGSDEDRIDPDLKLDWTSIFLKRFQSQTFYKSEKPQQILVLSNPPKKTKSQNWREHQELNNIGLNK